MGKILLAALVYVTLFTLGINAQTKQKKQEHSAKIEIRSSTRETIQLNEKSSPAGEKLKKLQSLILRGSIDAVPPDFP